jgi:PAS domain S-box-containing protein
MQSGNKKISPRENFLSTLAVDAFDDILSLAGWQCSAQRVTISFLNCSRKWQKINLGVESGECSSYAHTFPLHEPSGDPVGSLEVEGEEVKALTVLQSKALQLLAQMVSDRVNKMLEAFFERALAKEAYERQREFLDTVLENLSDGIVACNAEGRLTVFNRATREFHGLDSRSDIPLAQWPEYYKLYHADGKTIMDPSEIPLLRAFFGEQIQNVEMVVESVKGGRRNILCSGRAMFNKQGQKLGAMVTMHDITAVKSANSKIEATTKLLNALIEACPVGIAVFDLDENIIMWNSGSEKIFGWEQAEVMGKVIPLGNSEKDHIAMSEVRKMKRTIAGNSSRLRKNGGEIEVHLSMVPLLNENSELYGFMAVFIDISEVKQREMNLMESNRALKAASVAKSQFLANMSHEIRTPLNGVIGMTELILQSNIGKNQRDQLEVVHSSANNLLVVIGDILDFSKIEAGKVEVEKVDFNLHDLVSEINETLRVPANAKDLILVKTISGSLNDMTTSFFCGDPGRIRQILLNLVSNAIKFSQKGEVNIRVFMKDVDSRRTTVRFEVQDHGIGISEETMHRLFQPFSQADASTTRHFGGTGLGLSICKGLVELLGGNIGVESEVGSGSTFWFTVTLERSSAATPIFEPENEIVCQSDLKKEFRILLAEDNMVNQKVSIAMLAKLGYQADIAPNGKEALENLKKRSYDLVLMDCQMPIMDGYEATVSIRTLQGFPNNIPIIAMTANTMKGDREKCLEAGMTDYVEKPVRLSVLEAVLSKYSSIPRQTHKAS